MQKHHWLQDYDPAAFEKIRQQKKTIKLKVSDEKKNRPRKKLLYTQVAEQMNFYFSDANLGKDRFMKHAVDNSIDGYVSLNTFLQFHKLIELGVDVEDIATAVSTFSEELVLSEDRTKVKRKTPYVLNQSAADMRTLYLEGLPREEDLDHQWVRSQLGKYGAIEHISIPKFSSTNMHKGFAFVQFSDEENMKKCLADIGTKEYSILNPFPKHGTKDMQRIERTLLKIGVDPHQQNVTGASEQQTKTLSKKRQPELAGDKGDKPSEEPGSKKRKTEAHIAVAADSGDAASSSGKKRKRKRSTSKSEVDDSHTSEKLQKVDSSQKTETETIKLRTEDNPFGLKAITKLEWLNLKKQFLANQKAEMAALKKLLRQKRSEDEPTKNAKTVTVVKVEESQEDDANPKKVESMSALELIPDVVLKLQNETQEELTKEWVKAYIPEGIAVAYIDLKIGSNTGHIRCHNSQDAKKLLKKLKKKSPLTISLLQGDEEKAYWEKLNQDRREKRQASKIKTKRPKKRGKQKVLDQAEKLIQQKSKKTFDDSD